MEPDSSNRKPLIAGIIAIVILIVVVGGVSLAKKNTTNTADTASVAPQPSSAQAATDTADGTASYVSGSYSASGSYSSPGGTEEVAVRVTLDGNTITDVSVTTDPASPTSEEYQNEFKNGYKGFVVGKNIDDIKLSKVSGSSLTSQGFNAALQKIKDQAQSA
jgi:hypothetical protein